MPSDTSNVTGGRIRTPNKGANSYFKTHRLASATFFSQPLCLADLAAECVASGGGLIRRLALMTLSPGPSGLLMDGDDVSIHRLLVSAAKSTQNITKVSERLFNKRVLNAEL